MPDHRWSVPLGVSLDRPVLHDRWGIRAEIVGEGHSVRPIVTLESTIVDTPWPGSAGSAS
ncbi:hypothetical protein KCH_41360 [Kitasatospora cheerisanensis KCTC 2395]|uniref:Uncharacterized protein n=1 Tax=Kitasatospora cheerisanensis KCTC 2395 TaxID=1348663 RepID=A0A066Z2F1_9ACTN|nr:hypothetical protein KCH_41360 [Kitasatospora cheerisanensis KCTC 2395]